MIDAIRSEWIKIRTTRGNVALLVLAVAAPAALTILITTFGDFGTSQGTDTFAAAVLAPGLVSVYLAGVLGILGVGQEYRHNTIRVTFTAEPRRSRVLLAKVIVTTLLGLAIGLVSGLVDYGIGKAIFQVRDIAMGFDNPSVNLAAFAGLVVLSGLFTLAGFGLCAILRQPAATIPILLLWPLVGESLLNIVRPIRKWLPFQNGINMTSNTGPGELLDRVQGGLLFAGTVALLVTIGWVLVERRDA